MEFGITVLPGDGIGPEVVAEGLKVLKTVGSKLGHRFNLTRDEVGGAAIDKYGVALRQETLDMALRSDAVLFGAVGGPKWEDPAANVRPEDGLLALRKGLSLFANIRPVKVVPELSHASVIKPEVLQGVDMVVIRELTGGLYYGLPKGRMKTKRGWTGVDTMRYSQAEIDRVLRVGFELARGRRKKLTSVDKSNVLASFAFFREVFDEVGEAYPDVAKEHPYADAAAQALVIRPQHFAVMVMENFLGDILSDLGGGTNGGLGLCSPVNVGDRHAYFEPIHGSAPGIAGQDCANPVSQILTLAMMLAHLGESDAAELVRDAVYASLETGAVRLGAFGQPEGGTKSAGRVIAEAVAGSAPSG